jgi:hypothetical protein
VKFVFELQKGVCVRGTGTRWGACREGGREGGREGVESKTVCVCVCVCVCWSIAVRLCVCAGQQPLLVGTVLGRSLG